MLNIHNTDRRHDGVSRRSFLKVGALGVGALTLADLLSLKARGATVGKPGKAIIMIYLSGGPSHIDLYDMKPDAPVEIRGEFNPIKTNVPGIEISELLPKQAKIADKFSIIRNMKFEQTQHIGPELWTGFVKGDRPAMGSVVSRLRGDANMLGPMPPYVYIGDTMHAGQPGFLGAAHQPYILEIGGRANDLALSKEVSIDQFGERRQLLKSFDTMRRELDNARGSLKGMDSFRAQAMEMMTSNKARDAFDYSKEPQKIRTLYGKAPEYLQARRLVEAGVPVVTLMPRNRNPGDFCNQNMSEWDHHDYIFRCLRTCTPQYDHSIYALLTDLSERGMLNDVAVVVWGEMGRAPRIGTEKNTTAGRDHWPAAGFALMAGGGLANGKVVGATERYGDASKGLPYTPQNVLATLYYVLGIDPETTIEDPQGKPVYLLDNREKIKELV